MNKPVDTINTKFEPTLAFARSLDASDPLSDFRHRFNIPKTNAGADEVYFVGNSLGLQPKQTREYVIDELDRWSEMGVRGHFSGPFPWMPYHEFLTETMADLVGANADEVVMMNSLTANLHLMMATFFQPAGKRNKILIEEHAFPSDHYAVESQLRWHGLNPEESLIVVRSGTDELLRLDDILQAIDDNKNEIALILLPGVQYYTGQVLDMNPITELAHQFDIKIGFDLAHAAGNVKLDLHQSNMDFAVWCTYKYLNSGPGSVGGCFVHRRHSSNTELRRLAGWWGHDKESRFKMENKFKPIPTAEGWQVSNPPILSLAAIRSSLDVFKEAGGMQPLVSKSESMIKFFRLLLQDRLNGQVETITPFEKGQYGCQLSLRMLDDSLCGKAVHQSLESSGVMTDWREPNVIRAAPVPLYNSFEEIFRFVESFEKSLLVAKRK